MGNNSGRTIEINPNKDPKKSELMQKGIHLLITILDEVAEAAPLNYIERLTFIESNIDKTCCICSTR